jgi:type IV pilus assembly protein PilM
MIALNSITRRVHSAVQLVEVGSIGIDFSITNINLVQLGRRANKEIALLSYCSIFYEQTREELLTSPKLLRSKLRHAVKKHGFKGKKCFSSMPSNDVRILSINYTKSNKGDSNEEIVKALSERIDDDLSQYVIDYLPVRSSEKEGEQQVLVALAKRDVVISYLELLRYSGLHVEALDIRPAAIKRLIYATNPENDHSQILVINTGTEKSYLTITSGRRLLFDYQINIGAYAFVEKMSKILDMSYESTLDLIEKYGFGNDINKSSISMSYVDEEVTKSLLDVARPSLTEFIDEINRIIIFSASENHGESITKIYLLGSFAHWHGIDKYLNERLKIPIEALSDPLNLFSNSHKDGSSNDVSKPDMAVAAGLALRGLDRNE